MNTFPEIPCSETRIIEGIKYAVRKFGVGGVVYEETLTPVPTEKIIRTMNEDGTEDLLKQVIVAIKEPEKPK